MQKMCGSSPQRVVSHMPNIATLRSGTRFSTDVNVVWSYGARDYMYMY
jgi:hypothetical protein